MDTNQDIIGKSIICNGLGIGEIIDVSPLHEGGEEFYKVSFPKDKCTNYFSVNNKSNYRVLGTIEELKNAVEVFNSKHEQIDYSSTQERINTQKEILKEGDILKLAKSLSILNAEKELHAQVRKPFKDALSSFVDEIEFVLKIDRTEVNTMLSLKNIKG